MVGSIRLVPDGGFPIVAEMNDLGIWSSAQSPVLADYLNQFYQAKRSSSPAYGPFGTALVQLAAYNLNGEANLAFFGTPSEGTVY